MLFGTHGIWTHKHQLHIISIFQKRFILLLQISSKCNKFVKIIKVFQKNADIVYMNISIKFNGKNIDISEGMNFSDLNIDDKKLNSIFNSIDNGNKVIDKTEINIIKFLFKKYDKNKDGEIQSNELKNINQENLKKDCETVKIAESLNNDVCAKSNLGLPTTGKDIEKHCKLINETNVLNVLESYELLYDESLEDAIKNEWGLDKNIKNNILSHITKCVEKAENYNPHLNKESKINNEYYSGNSYKVTQNGDNMTIVNQDTGEKTIIDLEKICKRLSIIRKIRAKKTIQNLPAEVIIDISKELSLKEGKALGGQRSIYRQLFDELEIAKDLYNSNYERYTFIHDLGHALDFMGYIFNTNSTSGNSNFMNTYNAELQKYIDNGNTKYEEEWHPLTGTYSHKSGSRENYATWNEKEMFAECYTLLMTGDCVSKNCILTYFPQTLKAAKQHLDYIRNQSDAKRH